MLKRTRAADGGHRIGKTGGDSGGLQQFLVTRIFMLSCQRMMHQRITEGTNADLYQAAVMQQGAGIETDEMVL